MLGVLGPLQNDFPRQLVGRKDSGAEPPKLVRIGERVGQLTLKGIEPGRAVFLTAAGKRYEVQVPKAGS